MKKIIFFIFILFISNIFNSCSDELITIVDEYNPPYDVKVIPGSDGTSISINFWSGILADDFVGFNLYADTTSNFTNALVGSDGGYPTVRVDTHTRSNFTLPIPGTYNNGTLYYVAVTAFGTNSLAEGEKIETKVNAIPVVPRQEEANSTGFNITGTTTVAATTGQIKSYGYQTNFNSITVFTNNNLSSSAPYVQGGLYIAVNGNNLYKLRINPDGSYTSATHSQGNVCNTI